MWWRTRFATRAAKSHVGESREQILDRVDAQVAGEVAGGLSGIADVDLYGKWHCVDLPAGLPVPGAAPAGDGSTGLGAAGAGAASAGGAAAAAQPEELVERLPPAEIDGEAVRGYHSVSIAGGALLDYRTWVLESNGLPRRSEMTIDMPGFRSRSVMDFYDHGAPIEVELPDCLGQPG